MARFITSDVIHALFTKSGLNNCMLVNQECVQASKNTQPQLDGNSKRQPCFFLQFLFFPHQSISISLSCPFLLFKVCRECCCLITIQ